MPETDSWTINDLNMVEMNPVRLCSQSSFLILVLRRISLVCGWKPADLQTNVSRFPFLLFLVECYRCRCPPRPPWWTWRGSSTWSFASRWPAAMETSTSCAGKRAATWDRKGKNYCSDRSHDVIYWIEFMNKELPNILYCSFQRLRPGKTLMFLHIQFLYLNVLKLYDLITLPLKSSRGQSHSRDGIGSNVSQNAFQWPSEIQTEAVMMFRIKIWQFMSAEAASSSSSSSSI